jgi:hypothetical protein
MKPTTRFISKLAQVCEQLAPQGGAFWVTQPRACVEIFGNYEWHYIQSCEKLIIFCAGFAVAGSFVQKIVIDNVFRHTRSAWPQAFIYSLLLISFYQAWLNTPLDILPGWNDELHDGGQQKFAADYSKAEELEKKVANLGSSFFFRL